MPRTRAPSRRTSIRSSSRAPTLLYTGTPRCVPAKTTGPAQSVAATSRSISALNAFPPSASALTASHRARLAHSVESVVPHGHVTPGRSPAGGVASSPACWCGILEHAGGATDTGEPQTRSQPEQVEPAPAGPEHGSKRRRCEPELRARARIRIKRLQHLRLNSN